MTIADLSLWPGSNLPARAAFASRRENFHDDRDSPLA
jgi:hypothetical protein